MHLLCALTPDQNVVGSVDCGLHLAVSYASLMPTQNPIDLWGQLLSGGRDQAARIKQRCQFKEVIATALTRYPPDLKKQKAACNCIPVEALHHDSSTGHHVRWNACANGLTSSSPSTATATVCHRLSLHVNSCRKTTNNGNVSIVLKKRHGVVFGGCGGRSRTGVLLGMNQTDFYFPTPR